MTGGWGVSSSLPGAVHAAVPVVPVSRPCVRIDALHFATPDTGSTDWHALYRNGDTHALLPAGRDIQWWGKGAKITDPEWVRTRAAADNFRACFTRNQPIAIRVMLVASTGAALSGSLTLTPTLDGSTTHLTPATVSFTYPAGASEHWITVQPGGQMPDEVGRYILRLRWRLTGSGFRFCGPTRSKIRIYGIYGPPMDPDYDSAVTADTGRMLGRAEGTLTGTKKRLDHMMRLIGGSDRRHRAADQDDLVDLYWRLHKGINDTPGAAPYFDAGHDKHITVDGTSAGANIPVEDQWLAWVSDPSHWNDASCIGHVQLAKTMLAAVGLFARRTWVFPHTDRMPDGTTVALADTDLYCLGTYDETKMQTWEFSIGAAKYEATPKLMEPELSWENFEACMLSPTGKFLTGGYNTRSNPANFRANKGFNSASELLRWWSGTRRGSFRRFMCWVYWNRVTDEAYFWDVDGNRYTTTNWEDIRRNGKQLPAP